MGYVILAAAHGKQRGNHHELITPSVHHAQKNHFSILSNFYISCGLRMCSFHIWFTIPDFESSIRCMLLLVSFLCVMLHANTAHNYWFHSSGSKQFRPIELCRSLPIIWIPNVPRQVEILTVLPSKVLRSVDK